MTTTVDSLLDISLHSTPDLGELELDDVVRALQNIINAVEILTNEVERIRIATGTPAPP